MTVRGDATATGRLRAPLLVLLDEADCLDASHDRLAQIAADIAWWNVLLPAVGLSSPKPPTAVARRARLYSPMVGSRQLNLRSDNPHPTAAPPVLRPSVKFYAVFARLLTAANSPR